MKALIFDYDGVVVDSFETNYLAFERLFTEMKLDGFDRDYFRSVFGTGIENVVTPILQMNNILITDESLPKIINTKTQYAIDFFKSTKLIAGIKQFLELTHNRYSQAIATGNGPGFVKELNRINSLEKYFKIIISANDVKNQKPDPEIFLLAAKKLSLPPSECIVFEDSLFGIDAAKAAGMRCIALTTTHDRKLLHKADIIINDFTEMDLKKLETL